MTRFPHIFLAACGAVFCGVARWTRGLGARASGFPRFALLFALVAATNLLLPSSDAQAALRPPLTGSELKDTLTPDQYIRYRYITALKSPLLSNSSVSANQSLDAFEKSHDCYKFLIDVASLGGDVYGAKLNLGGKLTNAEITAIDYSVNGGNNRYLLKLAEKALAKEDVAKIGIMTLVLVDWAFKSMNNCAPDGFNNSYAKTIAKTIDDILDNASLTDEQHAVKVVEAMNWLLAENPSEILSMQYFAQGVYLLMVDLYKADPDSWALTWKALMHAKDARNLLQLFRVKYSVQPPNRFYYITKAAGIANDIYYAREAASVSSAVKTTLFALDFLDYYYIVYEGDLTPFLNDMGYSDADRPQMDLGRLVKIFMQQERTPGQTYVEYYGFTFGFDYFLGDFVSGPALENEIRRLVSENALLAFDVAMERNQSNYLAAESQSNVTVSLNPLLANDFAIGENGNSLSMIGPFDISPVFYNLNFSLVFGSAQTTLAFNEPGAYNIELRTHLQDKKQNTWSYPFSSYKVPVLVPASSIEPMITWFNPAPTLTGTASRPELSVSWALPPEISFRSGGVTGYLSGADTKYQARALQGTLFGVTPGEELNTWSGSGPFTVPVNFPAALVSQQGLVGSYQFELTFTHPYMYGVYDVRVPQNYLYSDLSTTSGAPSLPYLEVLMTHPDAASVNPDNSFQLTAGDKVRLYPRNDPARPNFSSLSNPVKVTLRTYDGVVCPVTYPGDSTLCLIGDATLTADGGVEFTAPVTGRYFALAVGNTTGTPYGVAYSAVRVGGLDAAGTGGPGSGSTTGSLNDTGIVGFGNDSQNNLATEPATHPGQDARFGRDAAAGAGQLTKVGGGGKGFDYSKIANDGSVLPESAALGTAPTDWACTRDNVTGLIWEVKTASGLRSQSHTYTWYDSNPATNGGAVGTASGGACFAAGRCDTEKFVADVNTVWLCGHNDWRMPKVKELEGLADFGRVNPSIDPTYFPNTPSSYFWSGSPYANFSNFAWFVYFGYGYAYSYYRSNYYGVRLVRGGQ
jgi:hypothetical protein